MTIPKIAPALLAAGLAVAMTTSPAQAEDNGGPPPSSCPNIYGGATSGVVILPYGWPFDPGGGPAPAQPPPSPATPPMSQVYLCSGGHWIRVAGLEVGLDVLSDASSVEVPEGTTARMTGTYQSASSLVTFGASEGTAAPDVGSTWTWDYTPDDGAATRQVAVTVADDDGKLASTVFDLKVTNVPPTVTSLSPSSATTLVGQAVTFGGTATDPSAADTAAGFTWGVAGGATQSFDTCGSHTVTGTATDKDGGVSEPFTSAVVQVVEASFRAPLTAGARNVVKAGQVVPVKVSVGCADTNVAGLTPSIRLLAGDVDPETKSDDPALLVPASVSANDTSGVMRAVDGGYLYNLKVPKSAAGTKYTVRVSPVDGVAVQVVLEVR